MARTSTGAVVIFAFCATASIAWSTDAPLLEFRGDQVCWADFSCPVPSTVVGNVDLNSKPAATGAKKQQANSDKPRTIKTSRGAIVEPASKPSLSAVAALGGPKFYKYPTIYRGETPPRMPPGAENHLSGNAQPYVQTTRGVWYWPGADSAKLPVVAGFDPQIVASSVMEW
jgi:hypothetical protein